MGSKTPTAGWRTASIDITVKSTESRSTSRRKPSEAFFGLLLVWGVPLRDCRAARRGAARSKGLALPGFGSWSPQISATFTACFTSYASSLAEEFLSSVGESCLLRGLFDSHKVLGY